MVEETKQEQVAPDSGRPTLDTWAWIARARDAAARARADAGDEEAATARPREESAESGSPGVGD